MKAQLKEPLGRYEVHLVWLMIDQDIKQSSRDNAKEVRRHLKMY